MAGIALSMLAAYAGPDRLVDSCVYEGRVFAAAGAGAGGDSSAATRVQPGTGYRMIGIGSNWLHVDSPDTVVHWDPRWGDLTLAGVSVAELATYGYARRCALGRYGYALEDVAVVTAGPYGLGEGAWTEPLGVWVGGSPPAGTGYAVLEEIAGEMVPVGPAGLLSCRSLLSHDGLLLAIGATAGTATDALYCYDGSTWRVLSDIAHGIQHLFAVDGVLHGVGATGCYRWHNWQWELVATGAGLRGVDAAGIAWWVGGALSAHSGRAMTAALPSAGHDIARYGGRTYVVAAGGLVWLDDARGRNVLTWDGPELDNLVVHQNLLYALGELDGAPMMLEFGGVRAGWVDAGRWRVSRVAPGTRPVGIGTLPGGMGQVVLQVGRGVRLDDLAHEWADGSGASPQLDALGTEWSKGPDNRPRLDSVAHQWSDGSGVSPQLDSVETSWSDGSGDGRPELGAVTTEWQDIGGEGEGGVVMLEALATEWADAIAGPETGEYVVFVTDQFEGAVTGVRVVLDEPLGTDWRAMLRLDREGLAVDAWDSYETLPVNVSHVPEQTGTDLRIAIIGPWADVRCPGIRVQVRTDAG